MDQIRFIRNLPCTVEAVDEDENIKYKAYTKCVVKDGIARKIENGGEEVAEIEMTVAVMPDDEGNGLYDFEIRSII